MKKVLVSFLLVFLFVGTAGAKKKATGTAAREAAEAATRGAGENRLAWKPVAVDAEDLRELLELKEMYVYKYDLSGMRDTTLQVMVQLDEYFGRDSLRTVRLMNMGPVYNYRDSSYLKTLKLQFLPQSDSTMLLFCSLEGRMMMSMLLKMRKIAPNYEFYGSYQPKTFGTAEIKVNRTVPVLLFGSSWYDEPMSRYYRWPVYRFCPEPELDEEMRSESFDRMPHYWIIRVGLQERRE